MAYHSGTVDAPLSKLFQAAVSPEALLQPAEALDLVLSQVVADGTLSYLDWRGQPIPWWSPQMVGRQYSVSLIAHLLGSC